MYEKAAVGSNTESHSHTSKNSYGSICSQGNVKAEDHDAQGTPSVPHPASAALAQGKMQSRCYRVIRTPKRLGMNDELNEGLSAFKTKNDCVSFC